MKIRTQMTQILKIAQIFTDFDTLIRVNLCWNICVICVTLSATNSL
jgi:hypothetical protein